MKCATGALVDVLIVQEDNHTGRHQEAKNNPRQGGQARALIRMVRFRHHPLQADLAQIEPAIRSTGPPTGLLCTNSVTGADRSAFQDRQQNGRDDGDWRCGVGRAGAAARQARRRLPGRRGAGLRERSGSRR